MYRRVFTPSIHSPDFSFQIPEDWYGKEVEVVAFPIREERKKVSLTAGFNIWGKDDPAVSD
ncbi:MAG: hypothetical protein LBG17_04560 [Bacteroidales bacterium]|nr:hypothetical protein [Bacteroidales bacterium]